MEEDETPVASTSAAAAVDVIQEASVQPTGSISITPLSGSQTSSTRALCHLLEFDDARILLDCGINEHHEELVSENYDADRIEYLEKLQELAPHLTLVLLSSPTVESLGLLPYLVSKLRLACPIYATFPCRTLGQLTLEEWVTARANEEARDKDGHNVIKSTTPNMPFKKAKAPIATGERADDVAWRVTREEIQLSFSRITPVVYSQVVRMSGRANSPFSLLAHPAGTTLGGTLWSLRSATTDSLLYAPTFNHVKERTLDPASFLIKGKEGRMEVNEAMRRVGILIIPSEKSTKTATKAKERDKHMLEIITETLKGKNETILLPTDSIGRFIEILVLLEQHWSFSLLSPNYPLCLLSKNAEHILFTIRRLAEAFGGQLGLDEVERERVLRFKNVRIFDSPEQLNSRYPPEHPKLVLAAPSNMSYGYSRQILISNFISNPRSLILLTGPGQPASLSSHLFELWNARQPYTARWGSGKVGEIVEFDKRQATEAITASTTVRIKMRKKVVLQGEELMNFLEEQRQQKDKEAKSKAMAERNRRMMEAHDGNDSSSDESGSSDSDDDEEAQAEKKEARAVGKGEDDENAPQGVGKGPGAYLEPGSGPVMRSWKRGLAGKGNDPNLTHSGTGAWDEFLDDIKASQMGGFDIYVRQAHTKSGMNGNMAGHNAASLANQQNARHRMFPFFERRRKVDGYGEAIDIEGWKTRNKTAEEVEAALQSELAMEAGALGKRKREEDEEEAKAEPPHKFVIEDASYQVRCKVLVVDMEGKADGRALRSILPLIEPKKLVIINGDPESTQDLATALTSATMAAENIYTPFVGEHTKVADVTKSFSLRLDDSLMSALALRKIEGYEVVPVKGVIGQSDESTLPVLIPSSTIDMPAAAEVDTDASMQINGSDEHEDTESEDRKLNRLAAPHFIGEIKLALLKNNLGSQNVPVSFSKGSLICGPVRLAPPPSATKPKDARPSRLAKLTGTSRPSPTPEKEEEVLDTSGGKVVVRREGTRLVLEGSPGDTFYTVRAAIYDLHAVAS